MAGSLIPNTGMPSINTAGATNQLIGAINNRAAARNQLGESLLGMVDRRDKAEQQAIANSNAQAGLGMQYENLLLQKAQNERAQATALRNKEQAGRNLLKEQNTQKMQGIVMNAVVGNPNFDDKDLAGILEANKDIAHNVDPKSILDLVPSKPKAAESELFYIPNKEAKLGYSPRMLTRDELPSYGGAISESTFNKQFGGTKSKGTGGGSGGLLFGNNQTGTWDDFRVGKANDLTKDVLDKNRSFFGITTSVFTDTDRSDADSAVEGTIDTFAKNKVPVSTDAQNVIKNAIYRATRDSDGGKRAFNQDAYNKEVNAFIASYKANQEKAKAEAQKILGGGVSQEQTVVQPQQVQRAGGVLSAGQANQIRNEIRSLEEGGVFSSGITSVAAKEKIDSKYGEGTYDRLKQ